MTEPTYPIAQPRSLWMRVLMMLLMVMMMVRVVRVD